jgi:hypothetical protein
MIVLFLDDDDDDDILRNFVWEDMENYKSQGENPMGSVQPQCAAKLDRSFGHYFIIFQQGTDRYSY